MKLSVGTFILVNAILVIAVVAVVVLISWFLLNSNLSTEEAESKAVLLRLKASAELYHSRVGFYTGLCGDIGVPGKFSCTESDDAYAIETTLSSGSYYCLDSSGFIGKTRLSKGLGTKCR